MSHSRKPLEGRIDGPDHEPIRTTDHDIDLSDERTWTPDGWTIFVGGGLVELRYDQVTTV